MYNLIFFTMVPLVMVMSPLANAHAPTSLCDRLLIDYDERTVYYNRWALPKNVNQDDLLNEVAGQVPSEKSIIILDTNPSPDKYGEVNLIRPAADRAFPQAGPNSTYDNFDAVTKDVLFRTFVHRTDDAIRERGRAVLIFDHHFNSRLLSTTSATPLTVDFLTWLSERPDASEYENVRTALRTGVILRDHSDPDIVLANLALSWLDDPETLEHYGPMISSIALFNDHGRLPKSMGRREQLEVLLGYNIVVAFEKWIPAQGPGAFEQALKMIPPLLDLAHEVARAYPGEEFTEGFLMAAKKDPRTQNADAREIITRIHSAWEQYKVFTGEVENMTRDPHAFRRVGKVLVMTFPPTKGDAPTGLNAMRVLKEKHRARIGDAKVLVMVAPVLRGERTLTHVKIRSLDPDFRLDPVIEAIRARHFGGGGRSGAGGLYASAGGEVTELQRAEHLTWLFAQLNR